jgi:2-polyprenyl-6-methoxyphenol hydroxylase-like FAD-dependent oxidoreductase
VTSVATAPGGIGVGLSDGTTIAADLLVGADGLHSGVRALGFGPEEAFVRPLGACVAALLLDRSASPDAVPGASYSLTEVGRAAALADAGAGRLVAFLIWGTGERPRRGTVEEELRHAFAGAGWHVHALLDRLSRSADVYFDEVAQVVMPSWSSGRVVLLGDAAYAVSLIAGQGATLAMAGAVVLANALADGHEGSEVACAAYETRLRPWVVAAQRMARRNIHLFTPASRFQLLAREAILRLASRPLLAPFMRRLVKRQGERL